MFTDEQIEGDFKTLRHEHYFKPCDNGTIMIDIMNFEAPYGMVGRMLNTVYLTKYMRRLLEQRNKVIKEYAEGENWRQLLQKG
jgi:ligand-binding SRPBCC domain-containing protein